MNRREAIIAGMVGVTAAVVVAPTADAQASQGDNPDLDQIRALLRAHDQAFTNHDLKGIMTCLTEKAAIMGSVPEKSGRDRRRSRCRTHFEWRRKSIALSGSCHEHTLRHAKQATDN